MTGVKACCHSNSARRHDISCLVWLGQCCGGWLLRYCGLVGGGLTGTYLFEGYTSDLGNLLRWSRWFQSVHCGCILLLAWAGNGST